MIDIHINLPSFIDGSKTEERETKGPLSSNKRGNCGLFDELCLRSEGKIQWRRIKIDDGL
jgi:hypothetical protein